MPREDTVGMRTGVWSVVGCSAGGVVMVAYPPSDGREHKTARMSQWIVNDLGANQSYDYWDVRLLTALTACTE